MLNKFCGVLLLFLWFSAEAQCQLINVQIGRRFAPVRRPYVSEEVIDPWGRRFVPGPVIQAQPQFFQAQAQGQPAAALPRFVIEIRVIQAPAWLTSPQPQAPAWLPAEEAQVAPWRPWPQPQAPAWSSSPQPQAPLVCGPGG